MTEEGLPASQIGQTLGSDMPHCLAPCSAPPERPVANMGGIFRYSASLIAPL
jgi:hypothetical protein